MIVSLNDADRDLRVLFCHSAHDKDFTAYAEPCGLRYYADNLAFSTRRRVTLCEIAEVTYDEHGAPTYTPMVTGVSLCHYVDQFVKLRGRSLSLSRAIAAAKHRGCLSADEVNQIWDAFSAEEEDLQKAQDEHRKQTDW